ncbi:hypothetical protein Hanom_Chr15g01368721 [Helianthus anomalus]
MCVFCRSGWVDSRIGGGGEGGGGGLTVELEVEVVVGLRWRWILQREGERGESVVGS